LERAGAFKAGMKRLNQSVNVKRALKPRTPKKTKIINNYNKELNVYDVIIIKRCELVRIRLILNCFLVLDSEGSSRA
jgi:hypothetical protein